MLNSAVTVTTVVAVRGDATMSYMVSEDGSTEFYIGDADLSSLWLSPTALETLVLTAGKALCEVRQITEDDHERA